VVPNLLDKQSTFWREFGLGRIPRFSVREIGDREKLAIGGAKKKPDSWWLSGLNFVEPSFTLSVSGGGGI